MLRRAIVAVATTFCLMSDAAPAGLRPVGVVIYATNAEMGADWVSAGSSLYEGERLTTEEGGELGIRSGPMMLRLEEQTTATLKSAAGQVGTVVELASGTLVFSTAQASAVLIRADDALIGVLADGATIAHVRVVSPKELRIFARRGSLRFSYHDETALIPEGTCYRVLLDSTEAGDSSKAQPHAGRKKFVDGHKGFLLVPIAAGAAAAFGLSHRHRRHHESPEEP